MTIFNKVYFGFSIGMGMYGFSRGYRCKENKLYSDKIVCGTLNSIFYSAPIINIFPLYRLINRIEVEKRQLDKNKYLDIYKEVFGTCSSTY